MSNDSSTLSLTNVGVDFGHDSKSIDFLFPNVVVYRYSLVNGENGCIRISRVFNDSAIIA